MLQQQARFDDFVTRYNTDRPHQALEMKVPADFYARSPRMYRGLEPTRLIVEIPQIVVHEGNEPGAFSDLGHADALAGEDVVSAISVPDDHGFGDFRTRATVTASRAIPRVDANVRPATRQTRER